MRHMQQEPFAETIQDSPELIRLERGQYSMLLHSQMSTDGSIYFSLPDQDGDLYEYEGDLDEALDDSGVTSSKPEPTNWKANRITTFGLRMAGFWLCQRSLLRKSWRSAETGRWSQLLSQSGMGI